VTHKYRNHTPAIGDAAIGNNGPRGDSIHDLGNQGEGRKIPRQMAARLGHLSDDDIDAGGDRPLCLGTDPT